MTNDVSKVAVVTGAAGGIGRATAELLASRAWRVLAVDRDRERLDWTAGHENISGEVADISLEEDNKRIVEIAESRYGGLDAIVLNAAISLAGGIEEFAMSEFDRIISVNLRGTVLGIRAAIPALRRRGGGAIVVTSSAHGLGGDAGFWAYSSSKHALIGVVKCVAREVGWEKIRINAVCPGPVRGTEISTEFENAQPALFQAIARSVPVQRWGEASEIAEAIAFLASPAASYVNGLAMPVDGGALTGSGNFGPNGGPTQTAGD